MLQQKGRVAKVIKLTVDEWQAQGRHLFGDDVMQWRFICPACNHVASVQDYKDAGATEGMVAFSCIGRMMPHPREAFGVGHGPCNYTGGGLIGLNPVDVEGRPTFAFARPLPRGE